MLEIMYDLPQQEDVTEVIIDAAAVAGKRRPTLGGVHCPQGGPRGRRGMTVGGRDEPSLEGLPIRNREECASARVALESPPPRANLAGVGSAIIGTLAPERSNAFDLIRLLLATAVVYSHAHLMGGYEEAGFSLLCKGQAIAGTVAVIGFFGISGYLVAQSFSARGDGWQFVKARLLRILPGFYFALVVTAYVLAPLIGRFNRLGGPWQNAAAAHFVLGNALVDISSWNIGDILNGLPFSRGSLNGALWSLLSGDLLLRAGPDLWDARVVQGGEGERTPGFLIRCRLACVARRRSGGARRRPSNT